MRKNRIAGIVLASAMAGGMFCSSPASALPQADHQLCYKFKDVNEVTGVDVAALFGGASCTLKVKAAYWCVPFARNSDDDPRGDALGQTVCYKVKCEDTGATITNLILDTFVGTHGANAVDFDKPKFVCAPVGSD